MVGIDYKKSSLVLLDRTVLKNGGTDTLGKPSPSCFKGSSSIVCLDMHTAVHLINWLPIEQLG